MAVLTHARAEELLTNMRSVRAVVAGDLMVDRYITGVVERVSPEAPVPVVRVEEERAAIGGGGQRRGEHRRARRAMCRSRLSR